MTVSPVIWEANPHRVGACPGCGNYRTDGRAPYLHLPGCRREADLQLDRYVAELIAGHLGGPPLYCHDPAHDHQVRR